MGATMSSAASYSGAAAAASSSSSAAPAAAASSSSSSAAPATHYYFCHRCFLTTMLAAGAACPLCSGAFVEEINVPHYEAPNPHPSHPWYFTTGCLFNSPASFVLRCRADADAFFRSEISPLRHLTVHPAQRPPLPLAYLEASIDHLLARGSRVYVVLAGVMPPRYIAPSNLEIARLANQINLDGRFFDTFITRADGRAVAALRDVEIEAGPQGGQLCAVCQETLAIGTVAAGFSCTHVFHRNCIVRWLQQQDTCPVCRFSPLTEEMIGPSDSVFRIAIPRLSLGLDLDENIVVLEEKVRGDPVIPPSRWA